MDNSIPGPILKRFVNLRNASLLVTESQLHRDASPESAAKCARRTHKLLSAELYAQGFEGESAENTACTPRTIACRMGCNHCCRQATVASLAEIALIVEYLAQNRTDEERESIAAQLEAYDAALLETHRDSPDAFRQMCPLDADGLCSIYPVRPTACRTHFSFNVDSCRERYVEDQNVGIPVPRYAQAAGHFAAIGQLHAFRRGGNPQFFTYVLSDVLPRVLRNPELLQRALAGEAVFDAGRSPFMDIEGDARAFPLPS